MAITILSPQLLVKEHKECLKKALEQYSKTTTSKTGDGTM